MPTQTLAPQGTQSLNYNANAAPGTAGSLAPTSGTRTLYDPAAGNALSQGLETNFTSSPTYSGIVDKFNSAQGATADSTAATRNLIGTNYGQDINYQANQNRLALDNSMTGRGLATNTALLANQQDQADHRIKALRDQENAALASNNAEGAKALSDLAVQEQTAVTNARTTFLSQYFGAQGEARSQASFQTPEQKAVMDLSAVHPDANILPTDSLQASQTKVEGSATYRNDIAAGKANITNAYAQAGLAGAGAGLSSASAFQTKTLTGLMQNGGGNDSTYIKALKDGSLTQAGLASAINPSIDPQGVKRILSEAIAQGYNPVQGNANAENIMNVGAGGIGGASTATTNWFSSFLGGASGTGSNNRTSLSTPSTNVSNPNRGQTTSLKGILYSFDGNQWVPIGNSAQ